MADFKPFTVVCIADDSLSTERVDLVENTFVAFVMAENVSEAMAAGQVQAAESGLGPNEPIDWAMVFVAEGLHRNVNDDPDLTFHRKNHGRSRPIRQADSMLRSLGFRIESEDHETHDLHRWRFRALP